MVAGEADSGAAAHQRDHDTDRREPQRRDAARRQRWTSAALAAIAFFGIGLASLAWWQRDVAIEQRNAALQQQSRFLASEADKQLTAHDAGTAMLLALEGLPDADEGIDRPIVSEAEAALFAAQQDLQELGVLSGHTDEVVNAAFSPDGRRIVTGSRDGTARVWDPGTGKVISIIKCESPVWSVAFRPDGRQVVTGSYTRGADLWDSATGAHIRNLVADTTVWGAAFSPDGRRVAATNDNTVQIWDVATGEKVLSLTGHSDKVFGVAFSRDGATIVTTSRDHTVRTWEAVTGRELMKRTTNSRAFAAPFSNDGKLLAIGDDRSVRIFDIQKEEEVWQNTFEHGEIFGLSFSPDDRHLAISFQDGMVQLIEMENGFETELSGHSGIVWSVAFSADGQRLVTASQDGTARIWATQTVSPQRLSVLPDDSDDLVTAAAFSPDGGQLLIGSRKGVAGIWDVRTGTRVAELTGLTGEVVGGGFSADNRSVATLSADHTLRIWGINGTQIRSVQIADTPLEIRSMPSGWRVVSTNEEAIVVRDVTLDAVTRIGAALPAASLATLSPDGTYLATSKSINYAEPVRVWALASGKEISTFKGHQGAANTIAFNPDGKTILTTGFEDWSARIWTRDSATQTRAFSLAARSPMAAFSPDGNRFAVVLNDSIEIREIETGKVVAMLDGIELKIGGPSKIFFSPDGMKLAVLSDNDRIVRIWRIFPNAAALVRSSRKTAPRCLTPQQRDLAYIGRTVPEWCARLARWRGGQTVLMSLEKFNWPNF